MELTEENADIAPFPPRDVVLEVRTGTIRPLGGSTLRSAIGKVRRQGPIEVTTHGLIGDQQQYALHGGVDKALHQYCAGHYSSWCHERPDRAHLFKVGGFGENISTVALTEENVCIGDTYRIGQDVVVQVSEPRQPCYKLNHRFEWQRASVRTQESGRTGWYLRVLNTGCIQQGDAMELVERLHPRWTIKRVQKYLYRDVSDLSKLQELAQLPELGQEIRDLFQDRLDKGVEDMDHRLAGIPGKNRIPVPWMPYRLVEKTPITPRVKRFVFVADAEGQIGETCAPEFGRFAHVRVKFGPDAAFTRAYSVVSGNLSTFELGIAREDPSRGGSVWLHDSLNVGDVLSVATGIESPRNVVTDTSKKVKHVFIVAGIGITAFLRELESLEAAGAVYEVHYAVRNETDAAYLERLPPDKTKVYVSSLGVRMDVATLVPLPKVSSTQTFIYCCGPPRLLLACRERTSRLGYPASLTYFEDFGGAVDGTGEPFEVVIKSSARLLHVPCDKSLLQVLNSAGLDIPSSCIAGNCGVCMVDYKSGEVEHRGVALNEEQKQTSMLTCVSRGKGRIVIDC